MQTDNSDSNTDTARQHAACKITIKKRPVVFYKKAEKVLWNIERGESSIAGELGQVI